MSQLRPIARAVLSPEEVEIWELALMAGIVLDPAVFKSLCALIHLNVSPTAVMEMLKNIQQQDARNNSTSRAASVKSEPNSKQSAKKSTRTQLQS